ncbi:MAG TPA: hypothetical protein VD969_26835 [Symbiobacteriaceae bacterium]|nr:hypothetical protein [Symbiobacteriaceae bacterium]
MMVDKTKEMAAALQQAFESASKSPFPGLTIAGEMDDLLELPLEVSMTEKYAGYFNARVLAEFNRLYSGRLAYLQFVPDPATGDTIMLPAADEKAYGAVAVDYRPTENAAVINLRLPMKRLNVFPQPGRVHLFPVIERKAPDGKVFLAFATKGATTKPAVRRKSKSKSEQAAQTAAPPSASPASAPAATAPVQQPEKSENPSQTTPTGN